MKDKLATQDYIKTIAQLVIKDGSTLIKNKQIASQLGVSIAAVNDMAKKLVKDKLVINHAYKGLELTSSGNRLGLQLIRHHRLWEVFLFKTLNIPWDQIHEEAEHLEHAASPDLMNRIDAYLGYPKVDPHGNPIPSHSGEFQFSDSELQLTNCQIAQIYTLKRFESIDSHYLNYLAKHGFAISVQISVVEIFEFDHSILVDINGTQLQLSEAIAEKIYVLP